MGIRGSFFSKDKLDLLVEKLFSLEISNKNTIPIEVLIKEGDCLKLKELGSFTSSLARENYTDEVLKNYDHVVKTLSEEHPSARLTILSGPPGTGKTHILKGMLSDIKNRRAILLSPDMIKHVADPSFVSTFFSKEGLVFFIEDADACLAKRSGDNRSDIQALLNLGDGIIGELMDICIVATTNTPKLDYDEAVTRKGRLCRHIEVGPLDKHKANKLYKNITSSDKEPFDKEVILADIYGIANDADREDYSSKPKKMGFGND
jgi:SpoVK/Ycf46/Vps4 family AAA+-type ATPase